LSYYTDYTSNLLQISTDAATPAVTRAVLYFVDSYTSSGQNQFLYKAAGTPTTDDTDLLADLTIGGSTTILKVSYSLVKSSNVYNLFILTSTASATSIIRYYYSTSGQTGLTTSVTLQRYSSMSLGTDAQTLFNTKSSNNNVQVMTFEISCPCTVTYVS
jgi:hypothetical protein